VITYFVACEEVPVVDSSGLIYCTSPVIREVPSTLVELTQADIEALSEAVLLLFITAFVVRFLRRYLEGFVPGRN